MFKDVRRKDRLMETEKAYELLIKSEYGTLATVGENSFPYAIPLSYVVYENNIYFHCARKGQKIENIQFNSKVCFSVVGETKPVYDNNFTTYYESVTVFGETERIADDDLKIKVLMLLCEKYLKSHMDKFDEAIKGSLNYTEVYKISILHITGKEKKPM